VPGSLEVKRQKLARGGPTRCHEGRGQTRR
jgi:hypothetical protein